MSSNSITIEELLNALKSRLEHAIRLYVDLRQTFLTDRTKINSYSTVIESIQNRTALIRKMISDRTALVESAQRIRALLTRELNAVNLVEHLLVKQISQNA